MTDPKDEPKGTSDDGDNEPQSQGFSQADVDRIVRERVKRERDKYADYDDLKKRAEGAKTLEDRVAEIERAAKDAEQRALRAEIANAKGLTANQAKRLIGASREELEADADELLADIEARESERKKRGNRVPDEGKPTPKPGEDSLQEFSRKLFDRDD